MMGDAYKLVDWYGRPVKGHSEEDQEGSEDDESDSEDPEEEDPDINNANNQDGKQQKVVQKQKAGNQTGGLQAPKRRKEPSDGESEKLRQE